MEEKVDVLICGAGPVGLLIAIQLRRLGISTCIIDAADKASSNFPRTLEMLDQMDLFEDMAQVGLIGHRSVTFKNGRRVQGRGWSLIEDVPGTFFDFFLNLRLKYSEDIFRERIANLGSKVRAPTKLVELVLDEQAADEYKVTSTCATPDGDVFKIKSKYIVGCDGASSAVRKLAKIPFDGAEKEDHWVRIDGVVKTNLPDSRCGLGAIESSTHGQVLWVSLDHGATRIGYVLTAEMYAKYGRHMKQEDAIREAKAALAPFELEFEQVDWHTVYVVKQFVAARFQDRERILLAGDSAHSHSSGSAQGMNVGTHDAVSLAWRLAGVINGTYKPEVLANYSDERRPMAQHVIENDKVVAALISGYRPERFEGRKEDPMELLDEFFQKERGFQTGLGLRYPPNLLNDVDSSYPPAANGPGAIGPDVMVHKQGFPKGFSTRLHEVTKYNGKFHVIVFSGDVHHTSGLLKAMRKDVDAQVSRFEHAIDFRTIVYGSGHAYAEFLGVKQFGHAYWDLDRSAHDKYKISLETGATVVLRPDGIVGSIAPLDGFDRVMAYLERIVNPRSKEILNGTNGSVGEMITADENNLYYKHANAQDIPQSLEQGRISSH